MWFLEFLTEMSLLYPKMTMSAFVFLVLVVTGITFFGGE